jgi:ATP-binding cassette, subfamily C, bacterial
MKGKPSADITRTLRQTRVGLGYAAILSSFVSLLMLITPLYTLQIYDRVMSSRSMDTLVMLAVVSIGGLFLYAILDFIRARVFSILGTSLARRLNVPTLQAAIVDALAGGQRNAGQAMRDLNDLRGFLNSSAVTVPMELIWAPLFLLVLFLLHPVYGWIGLGGAALLFTVNGLTDVFTRRPLAAANEASARAFTEIGSTVRHAEAIEAMGMLPALARRWQGSQSDAALQLDRTMSTARGFASATRALRLMLQIATLSAGAYLVIEESLSPGSMMASSILMGRLLQPFEQLIDGWRQWVFALAAFRRVRGLLDDAGDRRGTMAMPEPAGRLVVDRVTYLPPGLDRPILRSVSFALEPGEVLGVIGPSGAGKSTLARLLVGIFEPSAGGVYLDGNSTYLWERESFGRYVGYVPQSVALLDGTVGANIARMTEGRPEEVVRAARLAGVHDMIGRLPFGYDTPVGEASFALSGGQRQRIALARALFGRPRLLVLDEPNASLDHAGEQALLHAIDEAKADGTTVVMIAHRPSIVSVADKLLVLKDGVVEQFGPRQEIMKAVQPGGAPAVARLVRTGGSAP